MIRVEMEVSTPQGNDVPAVAAALARMLVDAPLWQAPVVVHRILVEEADA